MDKRLFTSQLSDLYCMSRLHSETLHDHLDRSVNLLATALSMGKPALVCGNGGSATDAQHIAGELVGKFVLERRALGMC